MDLNKKLYIGGMLREGECRFDVISPARGTAIGSIAKAGRNDALAALVSAQTAAPSWGALPVGERTGWMARLREAVIKHRDHLRLCIHLEMGKIWAQTEEDVNSLIDSLHFYAEEISRLRPEGLIDREGSHDHRLVHVPVGVAVAFLAWNFPLLNLAFKIGPAMAAGCPIIIKPSLQSPLSAYAVGELCAEIGLPPGVVNIIAGDNEAVGDTLSSSQIPALLTLIGSSATGRHIMKMGASSIKRHSMELGGNAPVLVFNDADIDLAADIIAAVKFGNAGQICVTPNRVFVETGVHEALRDRLEARAKATRTGHDPDDPQSGDFDMGPLIDGAALARVDALVQEAVADGAELVAGGEQTKGWPGGCFYDPTVLDNVTPSMRVYREEVFGPVISLTPFDDREAVLTHANDTDAGLTAYVFTSDAGLAEQCAAALEFGEIQINGVKYGIDLPHGGIKQSGIGHDCSHLALHDYLAVKRISRARTG